MYFDHNLNDHNQLTWFLNHNILFYLSKNVKNYIIIRHENSLLQIFIWLFICKLFKQLYHQNYYRIHSSICQYEIPKADYLLISNLPRILIFHLDKGFKHMYRNR